MELARRILKAKSSLTTAYAEWLQLSQHINKIKSDLNSRISAFGILVNAESTFDESPLRRPRKLALPPPAAQFGDR